MPVTRMDIGFPFHVDARGRSGTADYAAHVIEMIEQLLFTSRGERVNRPDFGCGLLDMVFEPNSFAVAAVLQADAQAQLELWLGDVIALESLTVTADDATLRVDVQYVLRATGERRIDTIDGGVGR
ncbi:GPW/gp25 family protein [Actinoplanes sp. CA-051413]|uniref:GPW/gp25 family protein n=1 Tax=Actinoplanes sp. CA-051413 TaxID=3239899 RepID=UPI003D989D6E